MQQTITRTDVVLGNGVISYQKSEWHSLGDWAAGQAGRASQ